MNETSLTSLLNRKRKTNIIVLILLGITALGILTIHLMLFMTNRDIAQMSTQIEETDGKIKTIQDNKDFTQYKRNEVFLAEHKALIYSSYFQAVFEALEAGGGALKSIQTQVKSDDPQARNVNLLISAESAPSFVDIMTLISKFKSYKQFTSPEFTSISFTRNDQGKDIFTFPISLSLNTNYANNSTK